jgi:hypothetical protein
VFRAYKPKKESEEMKKSEETFWRYPVVFPLWLAMFMSFTIFVSAIAAVLKWTM